MARRKKGLQNKDQRLEQYQRFRILSRRIHDALLERLPKDALMRCGERLGVYEDGRLYLDEYEYPLFFDFCLYHYRSDGETTVERGVREGLFPTGSDERPVLEALAQAFPAVFQIAGAEPGYGVEVQDLLRDRKFFVMDQGLSHTTVPDVAIGANLIPMEDVYCTSGAAVPLTGEALAQIEDEIERWEYRVGEIDWNDLSPDRRDRLAAIITRAALDNDMMASMELTDEDELEELLRKREPKKNLWGGA